MKLNRKSNTYPTLYQIEKINKFTLIQGRKFYQIKWVGFPDSENTWEPEEHITNIAKVLEVNPDIKFFQNKDLAINHQTIKEKQDSPETNKNNKATKQQEHGKNELNNQNKGKSLTLLKKEHQKKNKTNLKNKLKNKRKSNDEDSNEDYKKQKVKNIKKIGGKTHLISKIKQNKQKQIRQLYRKTQRQNQLHYIGKKQLNLNTLKIRNQSRSDDCIKTRRKKKQKQYIVVSDDTPNNQKPTKFIKKKEINSYNPTIPKQYEELVLEKAFEESFSSDFEQQIEDYANQQKSSTDSEELSNIPCESLKKIIKSTKNHEQYIVQDYEGQLAKITHDNLKKCFPHLLIDFLEKQLSQRWQKDKSKIEQ